MSGAQFRKALILIFLFSLVINCWVCADSRAEGRGSSDLIQLAPNEDVLSIITSEAGDGYLLTTNALYYFAANENCSDFEMLCENNDFAAAFEIEQQVILMSVSGELFQLADGQCECIGQIPFDFQSLDPAQLSACTGQNTLYFTYCNEDEAVTLNAYDLESKEYHQYQPFNKSWCAWNQTSQQVLGFVYNGSNGLWYLAGFDVKTQSLHEICQLSHTEYSYSNESAALLFSEFYHVYMMDMASEKRLIPGVPYMDELTYIGKGFYAGIRNRKLYIYSEIANSSGEVNVLGYSTRYNSDFAQETGIVVNECQHQGDSTMDDVATAILTHDGSVDVFAIWTEEGLEYFKQKGFYYDLNASPVLQEAFADMYPAIQKAMQTDNGRIAAWPAEAYVTLMTQDTEMLQSLGFTNIATWDEALDAIVSLGNEHFFEDNNYVPFNTYTYDRANVLSFFVQQYMFGFYADDAEISFDTDAFRSMAERILNTVPLDDPYPRTDGYEDALFCQSYSNLIRAKQLAPLRISADEAARINASFLILIVNPYSPHKEDAVRYIEYMATKRTVEDYGIYASMNEPLIDEATLQRLDIVQQKIADESAKNPDPADERDHLEALAQLEAERAYLSDTLYIISDEDIRSYSSLSNDFVVLENSELLYNETIESLIAQTAYGAITLDQFIAKADDYIQMVMEEKQ